MRELLSEAAVDPSSAGAAHRTVQGIARLLQSLPEQEVAAAPLRGFLKDLDVALTVRLQAAP